MLSRGDWTWWKIHEQVLTSTLLQKPGPSTVQVVVQVMTLLMSPQRLKPVVRTEASWMRGEMSSPSPVAVTPPHLHIRKTDELSLFGHFRSNVFRLYRNKQTLIFTTWFILDAEASERRVLLQFLD